MRYIVFETASTCASYENSHSFKSSHAKLYVEFKHFMWENLIKFICEMKVNKCFICES